LPEVAVAVGYDEEVQSALADLQIIRKPDFKPVADKPKNSYRRDMEMLQQQ